MAKLLGLRVDVDTHEGMRDGVPRLLDVLNSAGAKATFYLAMGPDRSGLAVFNLFKPGFLKKMGRTRAAAVYGWRTVLSGTFLPARPVATAFPEVVRRIASEGHEVGTHGWDHRSWQDRLPKFSDARVARELDRAREAFRALLGRNPDTAAAPAWLTDARALLHQDAFGMDHATDCRGTQPFIPSVGGAVLKTPQVPATLPTLDEVLGDSCDTAEAFFEGILAETSGQPWPVLTVHAELEGGRYAGAFSEFLSRVADSGLRCVSLGELLRSRLASGPLPVCEMTCGQVSGRHGLLSTQGDRTH